MGEKKVLTDSGEKPHSGGSRVRNSFAPAVSRQAAKYFLRGYRQNVLNRDGGKVLLPSAWSAAGDPGRPANIDALPWRTTGGTWHDLAHLELATGDLTHHGTTALVLHIVRLSDIHVTAKVLGLTPAIVRETVAAVLPRRKPKRTRKQRVTRSRLVQPMPPDLDTRSAVLLLYRRGLTMNEIGRALRIDQAVVREVFMPRWSVGGPCRICVESARKLWEVDRQLVGPEAVTSQLVRCPHYSQVFEWDGARVLLRAMTRKQFMAALRARAEPPTEGQRLFAREFDHDIDDAEARSRDYAAITATQAQYLQHGHYRAPTTGQGWVHGGSITDSAGSTTDDWTPGYADHRDHDW